MKGQLKIKNSNLYLILPLFILLCSCGKKDKSSAVTTTVTSTPQVEEVNQDDNGVYRATLFPVNSKIVPNVSGNIEIRVSGDDFVVEGKMKGVTSGMKHFQHIYAGPRCPEFANDTNKDGFIDAPESFTSTGYILIPLDASLEEQFEGMDYGPISNNSGSYLYRRSTSLSRLVSDLRALDPDPRDVFVKLPVGEELNLSGRVVMIHGVKNDDGLPESVGSYSNYAKEQTIPIACGVLLRQ